LVEGFGFKVQLLRVQGSIASRSRFKGSMLRVQVSMLRVQGSMLRVQGSIASRSKFKKQVTELVEVQCFAFKVKEAGH
jgi:hypothetical protein